MSFLPQPLKLSRFAENGSYRTNKSGFQTYYQCPQCQSNSTTRMYIVKHIAQKHSVGLSQQKVNMLTSINNKLQQHQKLIQDQNIQLSSARRQSSILKQQITFLKQKVDIFERKTHQNIKDIIQQVMIEKQTFLSVLKISLYEQIGTLLENQFEAHDIINKTKEIIIEHIKQIHLNQHFSQFKKDFLQFSDYIKKQHQGSCRKYRLRVHQCLDFLSKYSQKQFTHLQKMIFHIISEPNSKRIVIRRLFDTFRKRYSQRYKFPALPQRAFDHITKLNPRPKVIFQNVLNLMTSLKQKNDYTLMVDVWFCVCLGFRSRELKRIYLEDDDGNIANYIKVWEMKNGTYTNRIIPESLRGMIQKHRIRYPLTEQRWKKVVRTCLDILRSFYGLRALCITEIVSGVMGAAGMKFHKQWLTSITYYINLENKKIIDNAFAYGGYKSIQSTKYFIFHEQSMQILQLNLLPEEIHVIEGGQQIVDAMDLDSKAIVQKNCPEQQQIQHEALKQGFQLSNQSFKSINQIFNFPEKSSTQQISQEIQIPINLYEIKSGKAPVLLKQNKTTDQQSILNIVKLKMKNENVFKVDESTYDLNYLSKRTRRSTGSSTLPQNWPILKKSIKCDCGGQLQEIKCTINDHYINSCNVCENQNHECTIQQGQVTSQRIYCEKYTQSAAKFDTLQSSEFKNNIKQILDKQNRILTDQIQFLVSTPAFKTTMPKFSQNIRKSLEYIRANEQFLPLQIRKTHKKGYGVYSTDKILAGSIICLYNGVIVRNQLISPKDDSRIFIGMLKKQNVICSLFLDASKSCNIGRFLNSSSCANSIKRNCCITQGIIQKEGKCSIVLFIYSSRNIEPNQELLWWYGDAYWKTIGITPIQELKQQNENRAGQMNQSYQHSDSEHEQEDLWSKSIQNQRDQRDQNFNVEKLILNIGQQNGEQMKQQNHQQPPSQMIDQLAKKLAQTQLKHSQAQLQQQFLPLSQNAVLQEQFHPLSNSDCPQAGQLKQYQYEKLVQCELLQEPAQQPSHQLAQQQFQSMQELNVRREKFVCKEKNDANVRAFGIFSREGQIINNPNKKLEIASIVKLVLVKTCLDLIQQNKINLNLNSLLKLKRRTVGTTANLKMNNDYTVTELFNACLVVSGCEAAQCLAISFGQRLILVQCDDKLKQKAFMKEMNKTTKQLGMNETQIVDATGLGRSTSTIYDLNKLMIWASSNIFVKEILMREQYHSLNNSNNLLSQNIIGKTGNGIGAKFCFAGYDYGNEFSIIVLGADEREGSFEKVINLVKKMLKKIKRN